MANATGAAPVGGGSRLLGVNQLQTSIDSLTQAVQALTNKMGTSGPAGSNANFSNAPGLNKQAAGGNGSPPGGGVFSAYPTFGQMTGGANGGWMSTANGAVSGAAGAIAGSSVGGALGMAQNFGAGQLGNMTAMSSYLQLGSLYGGNVGGMRNNLTTLNDIANNANDLSQGNALLGYASGAWGTSNALSKGISGAANMIGMANPALGLTGATSLGTQMYSQQMAMNMMMMGYRTLPRTTSGQINSSQSVMQSMMQRAFGGKRSVNQSSFNTSAANGGRLNYNLQELGYSGANLTDMLNSMSAYNKLSNAGYSNQAQASIWSGAANHNGKSLADLQKVFGPNFVGSILQSAKDKTAVSTQRSGEEEQSYQSGLATSVGLINKFNQALNKILSGPLGKVIGYTGGMGASGATGIISGALSGLEGGGVLGGIVSTIGNAIGGGAAGPPQASMTTGNTRTTSKVNSAVSGAATAAVGWAEQELGVPYLWGGNENGPGGPGIGFDCSGLTQWAYDKAGIKIPRTSSQQWATLARGHSVPTNQVQKGDLIFTAGSDGTASAPGHVAMMVSNNMLIQAEETGTNIMLTPYDPKAWDHAARPTGPGVAGTGPGGSSAGGTASGLAMASGGGYSEGGAMGSTNEADAIGAAGSGGFMSGMLGNSGGFGGSTGGSSAGAAASPGTVKGNAALGKQLAAKRGWTGTQWNDLYALWQRESGWSNTARNASDAYGIAQALGHGPSNQYPAGQYLSANQPPTGSSNAQEQILWGLQYIGSTYGNPAKAWAHEQAAGWYARGTENSNSGTVILGEEGREAVTLPGGSQVLTAGQTAGALAAMQSGQNRAYGGPGSSGGVVLTVNIGNGAININGATGAGSDVSSSAREIAAQIGQYLEQESIVRKLAMGVSA
jgi:cell wall-associated NlpC family hydrolase